MERQIVKKWAGSLEELGLADKKWPGVIAAPIITPTDTGYVATVSIKTGNQRSRKFQVRADSRLTEITPD